MPGTTQFPAALDAWPEIGPNTHEDDPAAQHDVVHANEMAAIAALERKVGIDGSSDDTSLDARLAAVLEQLLALDAGFNARAAAAAPVRSVNGQTGDVVVAGGGGSSAGGILPMVNGEVPPALMYFDDGSLLYAQVA